MKLNTKFLTKIGIVAFSIVLLSSCETTNLDLLNDPNRLTSESADPQFILNGIAFSSVTQHITLSSITDGIMRHSNLFDPYANGATPATMNSAWQNAYSITANRQFLETLSEANDLPQHLGVAQVSEAFAYINLVDYIGSAVYSEAVNPNFPNPSLDDGQSIYNGIFLLLDEAIANLNQTSSVNLEDVLYNGDASKWIRLANTLKLKMYLQSKLVATASMTSDLNAIVSSGNYINNSDADYQLQFGTSDNNPDVRHPRFTGNYQITTNVYMSNDFMNTLLNGKTIEDPRLPYYIYRQDLNDPHPENIDHCTSSYVYCYLGGGYYGRDHGDDEGIPNDNTQRATFGIYPVGGAYDAAGTQAEEVAIATTTYDAGGGLTLAEHIENHLATVNPRTAESNNLGGAGIHPMITSFFVKFMLAEAALPSPAGLGANGNPASLLNSAMQESFDKVASFSGIAMDATAVSDYINEVMAEYNVAASDEERLNVIIREYYIAAFGNSIEPYNNYRRTGYPDLQGHVLANGGDFIRSFFIPESELNTNDNPDLVQKQLTDRVFWDTNPAGFID